METAATQLVPPGHCKKICPAGEAQTWPTTSISGGAPNSAPTASAVHSSRQVTSPEFVLPLTMQHTWLPVQSAFWSHETRMTGPPLAGHVWPATQARLRAPVLILIEAQQALLPLQVWLPQTTLGP